MACFWSPGIINDLDDTINAIVTASDLPLSILIVGVGPAEFDQMEALDSDKQKLRTRSGRVARRDIVQFVAMRDFMPNGQLSPAAGAAVSSALLAEVPDQLLSYMRQAGISPNPKTPPHAVAPQATAAYPPPAAATYPPAAVATYPPAAATYPPAAAYPPQAPPAGYVPNPAYGASV